jgi:hypothetical protein
MTIDLLGASLSGNGARPGWYLAPGGHRRWWDGRDWHDQQTVEAPGWREQLPVSQGPSAPVPVATRNSGVAIGGMIVGIFGLLIGLQNWSKPLLFVGYVDIFGPLVLGGLAIILAAVSGRAGGGFRVAAFICGGLAVAAGVLFIAAIAANNS